MKLSRPHFISTRFIHEVERVTADVAAPATTPAPALGEREDAA